MSSTVHDGKGALIVGGRYRLGSALGAGAMGVVYAATDERLGREVAIKVVRGTQTGGKLEESALARFEREAMLTGKLGHPNIVTVTDLGRTDEGYPYVVMERLEGRTLEARIFEGPVSVEEAVAIHVQLLDALACAHDAGVLHRDVKPANVFLSSLATGASLVKLLDFGIAAPVSGGQKLTMDGSVIGSPVYLSPERFRGQPAQIESEIYAVGISLYETLVGTVPFDALGDQLIHERVFNEKPVPVDALRADVPPALARSIDRALEKKPEARFHSAREMREALLAAMPVRNSLVAAEPSARIRSDTVRGVPDPSAASAPLPQEVAPPVMTPPLDRAALARAALARAALPSTTVLPKQGRAPMISRGVLVFSIVVVLASVGIGAFAGLSANREVPVPAVSPVAPVVASPVVPPAIVHETPPELPVGVDPPIEAASVESGAVEPEVDSVPSSESAETRPRSTVRSASRAGRGTRTPSAAPSEPPSEAPSETPAPRPRAHMGEDGLIHPNW